MHTRLASETSRRLVAQLSLSCWILDLDEGANFLNRLRLCDPEIIRQGSDFTVHFQNFETPSDYACYLGLTDVVSKLVETNSETVARDVSGISLLAE